VTAGVRTLTVRHVTVYRYSKPVALGEHRMMFRPRESHDLRLVSTRLDILPRPTHLRWLHDVFDNSVAIATFGDPTLELRFDSTVTLEHLETASPHYSLETGAQTYPFSYSRDDRPELVRGLVRHYPGHEVSHWAARFLSPSGSTGTMALLEAMTLGIRDEFAYVRRSEKGVQRPEDTLRRRSGSCRDFALFMMEAVRSIGLAARFVSGYIFVPEADQSARVGGFRSDQQHRRQSQSDSSGRRVGSQPCPPPLGDLHRRGVLVSRDGRPGSRHRGDVGTRAGGGLSRRHEEHEEDDWFLRGFVTIVAVVAS
jgi:transglutaminase-like putative cysteine protease